MATELYAGPGVHWKDVTSSFMSHCQALDVGELIHDANFGLYEAMSAFEMMDPKMDSGMIGMQSLTHPPKTLTSCIDSGELSLTTFTNQELCDLFDASLCALFSWIEGGSMAQTVFANLYLHNPFVIEHRVLKAFSVGLLKLIDRMREMITNTAVYEEEHFQSTTYGFQLADAVTPQRVSGMLKEADDEVCKIIRMLKSKDEPHELNGAQQVLLRLRILRNLFLMVLNIKYEAAVNAADDTAKYLQRLKEAVCATKESLGSVFPVMEDPFQLAAFDLASTTRLLPPSFPRAINLISVSNMLDMLADVCHHVELMLALPSCGIIEMANQFDALSLQSPCLLMRSFLLYHYNPVNSGKLWNKVKVFDAVSDDLKHFNAAPIVSNTYKTILNGHADVKLLFNTFLASTWRVLEGLVTAKCNTRSRQRERLAYLLDDLGALQTDAERTDAVIDTVLKEKAGDKVAMQFTSAIGTWILYITTRTMIQYLQLGLELELYDVREYCYVYWYMAEVLYPWNTSSLIRGESCLNEMAVLDSKASGKKKPKPKKAGGGKSAHNHQAELASAKSCQHIAGGLYKLLLALKRSDLLPTTGEYPYDNERVRYQHRFLPFAAISYPPLVLYDRYIAALQPHDTPSLPALAELLENSCRSFQAAKDILESEQAKHIPDATNLLKVAKNNLVVTRVVGNSLQKDVKLNVRFEFTHNAVFPVVKLVT